MSRIFSFGFLALVSLISSNLHADAIIYTRVILRPVTSIASVDGVVFVTGTRSGAGGRSVTVEYAFDSNYRAPAGRANARTVEHCLTLAVAAKNDPRIPFVVLMNQQGPQFSQDETIRVIGCESQAPVQ